MCCASHQLLPLIRDQPEDRNVPVRVNANDLNRVLNASAEGDLQASCSECAKSWTSWTCTDLHSSWGQGFSDGAVSVQPG